MRKKLCLLLSIVMIIGLLSGCGIEASYKVSKKGKITSTSSDVYYTAAELAELAATGGEINKSDFTKVKVNGKTYYKYSNSETIDGSEYADELTATEFVSDLGTDGSSDEDLSALGFDSSQIDFYNLSITFPYKVILTNGTLQSDGKTVTFDIMSLYNNKAKAAYAYTSKTKKGITLAKTNGTAVKNKAYVNVKKIKVSTYDKLKSITVNGKSQTSKTVNLTKDGKYTIKVTTTNFSKTFTVNRDTKAPTITGVKNNKTYKKAVTLKFKDSSSGVKKATLNGKTIKTGKSVSKAGSYTLKVTDKAGNSKTVKFTIK